MRLSTNFTLKEATKSMMAIRHGIDNSPSRHQIEKLQLVAEHILEPPRMHFGLSIVPSSWFRCLELNRLLRSRDSSQHARAEAVDFEINGVDNLELAYWMMANTSFDQLILEYHTPGDANSGWIHASYVNPIHNRKQVATITRASGFQLGLPDRSP